MKNYAVSYIVNGSYEHMTVKATCQCEAVEIACDILDDKYEDYDVDDISEVNK